MTTISHLNVDPSKCSLFVLNIIHLDRFVDFKYTREMPDVLLWRFLCGALKWENPLYLRWVIYMFLCKITSRGMYFIISTFRRISITHIYRYILIDLRHSVLPAVILHFDLMHLQTCVI